MGTRWVPGKVAVEPAGRTVPSRLRGERCPRPGWRSMTATRRLQRAVRRRLTGLVARARSMEAHADGFASARDASLIGDGPSAVIYVYALRGHGGVLRMTGAINARASVVRSASLVIKARNSGGRVAAPVRLRPAKPGREERLGEHWFRFSVALPWSDLWDGDEPPDNDVFDAWMALDLEGQDEPFEVRVGRTR